MTEDDEDKKEVHLQWKDYVAIIIAMFETVLVPVLVVILILVVVAIFFLLRL